MERDERDLPNKQRLFYHQISEYLAESITDWRRGKLSDGQYEKWVKLVVSVLRPSSALCRKLVSSRTKERKARCKNQL